MDLKHIIPQQRRRTYGPSFDIAFSTDKSNVSRVGPTPVFSRASSGTFVNENRRIVGKTRSTTSLNPANVPVGGVAVFAVPSGSVVGWLNNSVVSVMEDTDGDDQIGAQRHVTGTLIHKTDTAITLLVTSKVGTTTLSSWFVSYRGVRIDHDPATGLCLGHLHESSRTNLFRQSENFGAIWSAQQLNVTGTPAYLNVAIAPDGSTTADKLIANTSSSTHQFRQDATLAASTPYTFSCFFKAAEHTFVCLTIAGTTTIVPQIDNYAFFNLTTGSVNGSPTGFSSASVTPFGNGWYRCVATITSIASGTVSVRVSGADTTGFPSTFYTGDGTSGFLLWGAQFEAGLEASSYIPTTVASAARSDDVYGITGTSFTSFYNQTEGTVYSEIRHYANEYTGSYLFDSGNRTISAFGTDANPSGSTISTYVTSGPPNFTAAANFQIAYTRGSRNKIALAVRQNDFAASYNGATTLTDTSGVFPASPMTLLNIGTNTAQRMRGHIMRLSYYPQRLANTRLPTLTAIISEPIVYNGVAIWYNGEGLIETN